MEKISTKCPSCGLWFDNSLSNCPYCSYSNDQSGIPEKEENEKGTGKKGFGGLGGIISGIHQKPKSGEVKGGAEEKPIISPVPPTDYEEVKPDEVSADIFGQPEKKPDEPPREPEAVLTPEKEEPAVQGGTLGKQIEKVRKTVGRYIDDSGETISPVVGWLVGVKGKNFGQSFPIRDGKNKIGRSTEMEVSLLNDDSVSRSCEATIIYDSRANAFHMIPGDSGSLCYLNNEGLYERALLKGMEEIEFGNSGLNKYIFVPLCGESFQWSAYSDK